MRSRVHASWSLGLLAWAPVVWGGSPAGIPGEAIPLVDASRRCSDARFPTLAGSWLIVCNARGLVSEALDLETGARHPLPFSGSTAGVGQSAVYVAGEGGGLARLSPESAELVDDIVVIRTPLLSPPATDGVHIAALDAGPVQARDATDRSRRLVETSPVGWQPPVLAWPHVAWAARTEDGDADLFWLDADAGTGPTLLAGGPGDQHHVVSSESHLAWVEPGAVVVFEVASGAQRRIPADTGFSAPLSIWGDVVCWEDRAGPDLDVRCSDGLHLARTGHQQWPARWQDRLVFREDNRVWLYTLPEPEPALTPTSP